MTAPPAPAPKAYVNNQLTTDPNAGGGKYDVQAYTYPMDLFGQMQPESGTGGGADQQEGAGPTKYANAWVMININVQDKSMALNEVDGDPTFNDTVDLSEAEKNRFKPTTNRQDITKSLPIVTTLAGGVFSLPKILKDPVAAVSTTAGAGLLGAVASAPFAKAGITSRSTKRLKVAIQLPMPNAVQSGYSMNWGEDNTKMFDLMSRAPGLFTDAIPSIFGKGNGTSIDAGTGFILGAASITEVGAVSAATGLAANPKKEMIFESVNFRTFNLDYRFYPRSSAEMGRLYNIIKLLKYHMHPEFLVPMTNTNDSGMFTFIYPSEFDVTFYSRQGTENPFINKISTCVLTNINVNYTPDAFWVGHEDGSPNGIQMSLTFKELSILTKEQIAGGF